VRDGNLVTNRRPGDIPAFNRELTRLLAEERPGAGAESTPS
jgi:putative intracellular protease/amidase